MSQNILNTLKKSEKLMLKVSTVEKWIEGVYSQNLWLKFLLAKMKL